MPIESLQLARVSNLLRSNLAGEQIARAQQDLLTTQQQLSTGKPLNAASLGNKQFEGAYLFGGDKSTTAPFVQAQGGMQFVGSSTLLQNQADENASVPFMVDGAAVFGALSTRVQGSADLSPNLTLSTR